GDEHSAIAQHGTGEVQRRVRAVGERLPCAGAVTAGAVGTQFVPTIRTGHGAGVWFVVAQHGAVGQEEHRAGVRRPGGRGNGLPGSSHGTLQRMERYRALTSNMHAPLSWRCISFATLRSLFATRSALRGAPMPPADSRSRMCQ